MAFHIQEVILLQNKLAPMCCLILTNSSVSTRFKYCSHPTVLLQKLKWINEGDVYEVEKINNLNVFFLYSYERL